MNWEKVSLYKIISKFETCQRYVTIYDTNQLFMGEKLYIIKSIAKEYNKRLIRFGTYSQMLQIIRTYRLGSEVLYNV